MPRLSQKVPDNESHEETRKNTQGQHIFFSFLIKENKTILIYMFYDDSVFGKNVMYLRLNECYITGFGRFSGPTEHSHGYLMISRLL